MKLFFVILTEILSISSEIELIDPEVHPQPETYWGHVNPIGPRACYDEGKRVAETMCYAYQKQVLIKYFTFCFQELINSR